MLRELTSDVVAAYVRSNPLPATELAALIASVHAALARQRGHLLKPPPMKPIPAVPIAQSVTKEFIVCLEDGRRFKSMKRHLMVRYRLTPDEYRVKWDLPADYTMVAESHREARSRLAKAIGLGRKLEPKKPARQEAEKPS